MLIASTSGHEWIRTPRLDEFGFPKQMPSSQKELDKKTATKDHEGPSVEVEAVMSTFEGFCIGREIGFIRDAGDVNLRGQDGRGAVRKDKREDGDDLCVPRGRGMMPRCPEQAWV